MPADCIGLLVKCEYHVPNKVTAEQLNTIYDLAKNRVEHKECDVYVLKESYCLYTKEEKEIINFISCRHNADQLKEIKFERIACALGNSSHKEFLKYILHLHELDGYSVNNIFQILYPLLSLGRLNVAKMFAGIKLLLHNVTIATQEGFQNSGLVLTYVSPMPFATCERLTQYNVLSARVIKADRVCCVYADNDMEMALYMRFSGAYKLYDTFAIILLQLREAQQKYGLSDDEVSVFRAGGYDEVSFINNTQQLQHVGQLLSAAYNYVHWFALQESISSHNKLIMRVDVLKCLHILTGAYSVKYKSTFEIIMYDIEMTFRACRNYAVNLPDELKYKYERYFASVFYGPIGTMHECVRLAFSFGHVFFQEYYANVAPDILRTQEVHAAQLIHAHLNSTGRLNCFMQECRITYSRDAMELLRPIHVQMLLLSDLTTEMLYIMDINRLTFNIADEIVGKYNVTACARRKRCVMVDNDDIAEYILYELRTRLVHNLLTNTNKQRKCNAIDNGIHNNNSVAAWRNMQIHNLYSAYKHMLRCRMSYERGIRACGNGRDNDVLRMPCTWLTERKGVAHRAYVYALTQLHDTQFYSLCLQSAHSSSKRREIYTRGYLHRFYRIATKPLNIANIVLHNEITPEDSMIMSQLYELIHQAPEPLTPYFVGACGVLKMTMAATHFVDWYKHEFVFANDDDIKNICSVLNMPVRYADIFDVLAAYKPVNMWAQQVYSNISSKIDIGNILCMASVIERRSSEFLQTKQLQPFVGVYIQNVCNHYLNIRHIDCELVLTLKAAMHNVQCSDLLLRSSIIRHDTIIKHITSSRYSLSDLRDIYFDLSKLNNYKYMLALFHCCVRNIAAHIHMKNECIKLSLYSRATQEIMKIYELYVILGNILSKLHPVTAAALHNNTDTRTMFRKLIIYNACNDLMCVAFAEVTNHYRLLTGAAHI